MVSVIEAEMEDRGEAWLESEEGAAAERLRLAWLNAEIPNGVRVDDLLDGLDELADLPTTPDET